MTACDDCVIYQKANTIYQYKNMLKEPDSQSPRVDSTLTKGLLILEALTVSNGSVGVSELSRRLGLTKSNTFRLLQTLLTLGYVRREIDKTYSATLKTWQVGRSVVENLNLRTMASPAMRFLSDETRETIYLAVRDGLQVVYIDKIESLKPIRSWNPIGGTAPLYCVGTGKAILATEFSELREAVAEQLTDYTDRTILSIDALDEEMKVTRARGYAVDRGEFRPQIFSFGAPVYLPDGTTAGALGISVPEVNLGEGDVEKLGNLVYQAGQQVTEKLARL